MNLRSRKRLRPSSAVLAAAGLALSVLPVLALSTPAGASGPALAGLWTATGERPAASKDGHRRTVNPSRFRGYTLDRTSLTRTLAGQGTLEVPAPTGELVEFAVGDSPVMEPSLAAAHPDIRTYAGTSVTEGYVASIRLDVTPLGFHASVRDGRASWYVDPAYLGDESLYLSYYGRDLPAPERGLVEPELAKQDLDKVSRELARADSGPDAASRVGEGPDGVVKRRLYRLALVTDASYAEYVAPGLNDGAHDAESNTAVLAAKVTLMNRVNQIYNDDLAIHMDLVANSDLLNLNTVAKQTAAGYPASGSGSIAGGCTGSLLNANQTVVDTLIGSANYDIGHIALGINGGGIAGLGVVGRNGQKGRGCTGLPDPIGDFMAIDYVAHEMGHQFAGNHSFNGNQANCSSTNRNAGTSVEPGSGSSVMAYAGICGSDDLQPHTDPYFSQRTQTEVSTYVNGTAADTRGGFQVITTTNHNPDVTAPAAATIPVRTPFTLTGSATDSDGDGLIYLWEQNDRGAATGTGLVSNTKANGPLFRVFGDYANVVGADTYQYNSPGENIATANPSRTFPDMEQILAGNTNIATGSCPTPTAADFKNGVSGALKDGPVLDCFSEYLPTATYLGSAAAGNAAPPRLNFRLTARDLKAGGGGTDFADVTLTVNPLAGPFLVTSQAGPVSYTGGSSQTVTWDKASTDTLGLATNVKITLSTDGGETFPTVLAASTANDGSEAVTIPNSATTEARIKVEAVGNYFFAVNASDFTITAGAPVGLEVTQPGNPTQSVQYSDPIAAVAVAATTDTPSGVLAASVDPATPLPAGLSLSARSGSDASASWTVAGTANVAPGSYGATVKVTDGTETVDVPLTFTVTAEDATVAYTGPPAAATTGGDPTVDVALTATVAQAADGSPGDLTTATAAFKNGATTLCTSPVAAGGAASCTYAAAPGVYNVTVDVGGRFAGTTAAATTLTVTGSAGATPDTAITSGPAKWLLDTVAKYVFASTESDSTFTCSLDGASAPCTSPTTRTGLSQATHVFTVAATKAGQTDPTPARSVTTVPLDDRALKAKKSGKWKQKKSKKSYLGTFVQTKTKGAVLTYKVKDARSLALVVATAKNDGKVAVYLNGKLLKKVKLKGAKSQRKVVDLGTFLNPTSGKVKIVTLNKKRVRIDGLGVATSV